MKRILKIIAIILIIAFAAIQFFRPDFNNPPVNPSETLESSGQVPENVQAVLKRSCYDCHSNETVYPWYSKIQPSAWFLADHISEGRRELNFSVWKTYETRRQSRKLEEMCEQVQSGEMPLSSYLWMHWGATLSVEEVKTICDWTEQERAKFGAAK